MGSRIIVYAKYNSHTEPICKKLNILPFPSLCEFFKNQFMQQFMQKFLPVALKNLWVTNVVRRENKAQFVLRNDDLLYVPPAHTSLPARLPLTSFPKIWTDFPDEGIKFIRNKLDFNNQLKTYFINKLSQQIVCSRLLCPDCHLNAHLN